MEGQKNVPSCKTLVLIGHLSLSFKREKVSCFFFPFRLCVLLRLFSDDLIVKLARKT